MGLERAWDEGGVAGLVVEALEVLKVGLVHKKPERDGAVAGQLLPGRNDACIACVAGAVEDVLAWADAWGAALQ